MAAVMKFRVLKALGRRNDCDAWPRIAHAFLPLAKKGGSSCAWLRSSLGVVEPSTFSHTPLDYEDCFVIDNVRFATVA
jgi:hypothetical protein